MRLQHCRRSEVDYDIKIKGQLPTCRPFKATKPIRNRNAGGLGPGVVGVGFKSLSQLFR